MVQIYNLYIQYVNNSISTCFTCGDKTAREHSTTLEQIYIMPPPPKKPEELTVNDAEFKLKMNIKWAEQGLCIYCGAKDGLIETDVVGCNVRLKACKTKCGYETRKYDTTNSK